MRKIIVVGAWILLSTAMAQAQTREGVWAGLGLGVGSLNVDGPTRPATGAIGYVKVGTTISEQLLLGGELNGWLKEDGGDFVLQAQLSAVAYLYPSATSHFFFRGGLGVSRFSAGFFGLLDAETGLGVVLGVGFDAHVSTNFSVTPVVNLDIGVFESRTTNVAVIGVGLTWH